MKNIFSTYHPVVNLVFIVSVITFSVIFINPIFLVISLTASFIYTIAVKRKKALKFDFFFALPLLLIIAGLNPVFVHQGFTMLFYVDDNPITLESIYYGAALAVMIVSVLLWLSCCNELFSSDKIIWLFGRIVPFLGLFISMTLRLIPRMGKQLKRISCAQKTIGMGMSVRNPVTKIRNGLRILSVLITWTLENLIEISDSMKARGFGLPGRTAFSIFRFDRRDGVCLTAFGAAIILCTAGILMKCATFQYYPYLKWTHVSTYFFVMAAAYAFLCILPTALEIREDRKWRLLKSKI